MFHYFDAIGCDFIVEKQNKYLTERFQYKRFLFVFITLLLSQLLPPLAEVEVGCWDPDEVGSDPGLVQPVTAHHGVNSRQLQ